VSRCLYQVRAYNIRHSYNVNGFLEAYRLMLQKAIDEIWREALYICAYRGLRINRQLNAAINLYLQMEGLPPSQKLFQELMKGWRGFTQTGGKD